MPEEALVHHRQGLALEHERPLDALRCFEQATRVQPDFAHAHYCQGVVLHRLHRSQEALIRYQHALALQPDHAQALGNTGVIHQEWLRLPQAIECFDRALAIDPDYADAWHNKSLSLLLSGDFDQGLPLYEWRWRLGAGVLQPQPYDCPRWQGQDISGRTVLLHCEQGLGDTLQFCRYAPMVRARGARVVMAIQSALAGVMRSLDGVDQWVTEGQVLPPFDLHCPLLSLPLAMGTRLHNIPAQTPYVAAPPERVRWWGSWLGPRRRPRVGLVWSGNTGHSNDHHRSLTLAQLAPHLPQGVEWHSLQKDIRPVDHEWVGAIGLRHWGPQLRDFGDTAALCEHMDLIVSVDTSVAHLAGALHRPTWVLLPFSPDWRWLTGRDDSPWYPTVRLFRQPQHGDWHGALSALAQALQPLTNPPSRR